MSRLPLVVAATATISLVAAGAAILALYDPHSVLRAVARAHVSLLLWALPVSAFTQVLRAQRVAVITRPHYRISLEQTFGARVLSRGVTSIVPLGPAGIGLEGLLLRRLAQIPIGFASGVFVACAVLDHVSVIPLLALAFLGMHLPEWIRLLLLGALVHSVLLLLVPLLAAVMRSRLGRMATAPTRTGRHRWRTRLLVTMRQVDDGLAAMVAGGWRVAVSAFALSFLIVAASLLRLALLLAAFELKPSPHQLVLLLLMGGLMGSMPVQLPGASTWATGKLLRIIHVLGPGAGAFVLLSSVIGIVEAPLLALGMLVWWALPHSQMSFRLSELATLSQESRSEQPGGVNL